ncbi:TrmJ/YjtD family RNA methyltransferase [Candidatus Woesearchaeota archaeon]|nr:MAG: TrmJ/YjtD family RNA methyltransferase [Candidatus Woesearchaeota archaeon]
MKNIYIVAQEFHTAGNCGALARVMKNFNCNNLVFLNPKCDYLSKEAMDRATHAKDVLKNAIVIDKFEDVLKKFDYVVGTTAMIGTDYNIPRLPITPETFAKKLTNKTYAIIIGREGEGMSNEEIKKCDFSVTVPSSKEYPVMNVSHAAAIILYELFKHSKEEAISDKITYASLKDKEVLLKLINDAIQKMDFNDDFRRRTQKIVWKRVVGKAMLTKREVYSLCGFFQKIK